MNSLLLTAIQSGRIWDFSGGIHPPEMKRHTSRQPVKRLPLSDHFILPLQQHSGVDGELLVNIGDKVLKGQPLTAGKNRALPIHAPTSGTITDIGPYTVAHPSGLAERCIYLTADGKDEWVERRPVADYQRYSAQALIEKVHQAGIAGLGGAGFPTAAKLNGGLDKIETLLINAAECEPYITADDRLMQEHAAEIVEGINILRYILKPVLTIIGIEDNKPEAIAALNNALADQPYIILRVIPTKYPSGGARQLTQILTGREVPYGKHSSSIGVLMQNVGTVYAIKRAVIDDEPLIERIATLTGEGLKQQGNVWVPLGTPVRHLLNQCGYQPTKTGNMVIMGGPLMGFTLPHLNVPVVKITNCILVPSQNEITVDTDEQNCIRCSQCADACPSGLLPQQLYWFSRGKEYEKARNYHLFDCIECGSCAYVCPSNIPLIQYYRQAKAEIKELDNNELLARQAKQRFEAKQIRLEKEKLARQQRHKQAAVQITDQQNDEIQAALARVKAKQATAQHSELAIKSIQGAVLPDNSHMAAAREARKALARQRRLEKAADPVIQEQTQADDPRKQAVLDAINRAKARKQAMQQSQPLSSEKQQVEPSPSPETEIDPRKAAVAAAIARAKARKQNLQQSQDNPVINETASANLSTTTPEQADRKAAVAAAIERAKQRKAQLNTMKPSLNEVDE